MSDVLRSGEEVSVVVCAFSEGRWEELCAALTSLERQSRVPEDVVLVIDHNEALYERSLAAFERVTVVRNAEQQGLSGARNTGFRAARGSIVLFLDDDATAERHWVENMMAPLNDPDVVGVGGFVLPAWAGGAAPGWFPEEFHWVVGCSYRGLPPHRSQIRNPIGAAMAFRTDSLKACGGFTSELGRIGDKPVGCEETDLALRITAAQPQSRVVLARDAVVHHSVPRQRQTADYFFRRCYWEGVSKAVLARRLGTGASTGLSDERNHALRTLPQGMALAVVDAWTRRSPSRVLRAASIALGLAVTAGGYAMGRLQGTGSGGRVRGEVRGEAAHA
ncbi:glycosyltransferase family 2 protein [Citricoccus nitrophenolicus]|uniref:Glycosyltransferase family 2 protein n=1 Tax=Citricoccus nitrophenolicus TaxID=863575 RepID=A0ABV0IJN4_9MICC